MVVLTFSDGAASFRQKIVLSVLTNKRIKITNIRDKLLRPGINEAEMDFLRIINEISNGAVIKINDTGCIVEFSPGTLMGGNFSINCSCLRGLGYHIEPLIILSPFTKLPMSAKLFGVTNNQIDPSIDLISQTWLPIVKKFITVSASASLKIDIIKRGLPPKGCGEILLTSKPVAQLHPLQNLTQGKVYKIRGTAWTCRVSPSIGTQLIYGAKELLNCFLSDVYIRLDHYKREVAGESSGYGLCLWAETKEGTFFAAEAMTDPEGVADSQPVIPSELGKLAASRLLDQIYQGGCVDETLQSLVLTLMACEGGRNANQLLISAPTAYTIANLRLIRQFLGVVFDFAYQQPPATGEENETAISATTPTPIVATCFGCGLKNINLSIR